MSKVKTIATCPHNNQLGASERVLNTVKFNILKTEVETVLLRHCHLHACIQALFDVVRHISAFTFEPLLMLLFQVPWSPKKVPPKLGAGTISWYSGVSKQNSKGASYSCVSRIEEVIYCLWNIMGSWRNGCTAAAAVRKRGQFCILETQMPPRTFRI